MRGIVFFVWLASVRSESADSILFLCQGLESRTAKLSFCSTTNDNRVSCKYTVPTDGLTIFAMNVTNNSRREVVIRKTEGEQEVHDVELKLSNASGFTKVKVSSLDSCFLFIDSEKVTVPLSTEVTNDIRGLRVNASSRFIDQKLRVWKEAALYKLHGRITEQVRVSLSNAGMSADHTIQTISDVAKDFDEDAGRRKHKLFWVLLLGIPAAMVVLVTSAAVMWSCCRKEKDNELMLDDPSWPDAPSWP